MANKRKTRKVSKRVMEMQNDSTTVWGKNPELETFWGELASGKKVILIYKGGIHTYVTMPKRFSTKHETMMTAFKEDPTVLAILSSNPSQDAYEEYLYPKAKDKSVKYVIDHYARYFKPILSGDKLRVPL
jgi:hypothetical protein